MPATTTLKAAVQKLSKNLQRLQATGRYEWSRSYQRELGVAPPRSRKAREELLEILQGKAAGFSFCDDVIEVYQCLDELRLGWASKTFRRDRLAGNLNITSFWDLHMENAEELREVPTDLGFPARLGQYRLFDWLGATERTVIRLCGKGEKPDLVCVLANRAGQLKEHRMKLSPAEYVRLGCLAFGLAGWQSFFLDGASPPKAKRDQFAARLEAIAPSSAAEFARLAGL